MNPEQQPVKSLQECKDEIANGYDLMPQSGYAFQFTDDDSIIDEVAELYASQFQRQEAEEERVFELYDQLTTLLMAEISDAVKAGWKTIHKEQWIILRNELVRFSKFPSPPETK